MGKYLLIQVPGWILAAGGLTLLGRWVDIPVWAAVGLFLLCVVKDVVLYPFVRRAYQANNRTGPERLIGAEVIVEEQVAPSGYIRIGAELWRAEAVRTDEPIPPGSRVTVRAVRGLTLLV